MKKRIQYILFFLTFFSLSYAQLDPGMPKKQVQIESNPSGADVYIKTGNLWEFIGQTPIKKEIKIGEKEIKISKSYYFDYFMKLNSLHQNKISVNLAFKPLFTGNPHKDLIGQWNCLSLGEDLNNHQYKLPAQFTFKANGSFLWETLYFSKKLKIKGKFVINTFTKPNLIDLYQEEIWDPSTKKWKTQKTYYQGIFKFQTDQLNIVFYPSYSKARIIQFHDKEIQVYQKISNETNFNS